VLDAADIDAAALVELLQPELVAHLELLAFRRERAGQRQRCANGDLIGRNRRSIRRYRHAGQHGRGSEQNARVRHDSISMLGNLRAKHTRPLSLRQANARATLLECRFSPNRFMSALPAI
jgi:hypothetical protein